MYDINLKTAVTASKAALPSILKSSAGRIINIGAGAAAKAAAGMGAYAASKSGVLRLTESLSEEVKDRGVTVNAVLPGTIDTPQNRKEMPKADTSKWVQRRQLPMWWCSWLRMALAPSLAPPCPCSDAAKTAASTTLTPNFSNSC